MSECRTFRFGINFMQRKSMRINKLRLGNFKCIENGEVHLSKITLITGANSSGKSSIINGLLGMFQADVFPLTFSPNGDYAEMGDFNEICFKSSQDKVLRFEVEIEDQKVLHRFKVSYLANKKNKMPALSEMEYENNYGSAIVIRKKRSLYHLNYYLSESDEALQNILNGVKKTNMVSYFKGAIEAAEKEQDKKTNSKKIERQLNEAFSLKKEGEFSFKDITEIEHHAQRQGNFFVSIFLASVFSVFRLFSSRFNYVGSYRNAPLRTYYQTTKTNLKVEKDGINYTDQISLWQFSGSDKLKQLNQVLEGLGVSKSLKIKRLEGGRYEVRIIPNAKAPNASLVDVGFGVSQLLPILVADLQIERESLLAVSQPEMHLHPSVQAELANYFVKRTKDKHRYILETHSEYLLTRIRLLIARGEISEKDVSVLYLEKKEDRSVIHNILFRKNGQIEGAPPCFFKTYMMDVMNIAMEVQ